MKTNKKLKKKNAFSLVEVIISLGIIAILMVMLLNTMFAAVQISVKSLGRSFIREELSNITSKIDADIGSADALVSCGLTGVTNSCELVIDGQTFVWDICENKICKTNKTTSDIIFISSENIKITKLEFGIGYDNSSSITERNILLTIIADHNNNNLKIKNIVRQQSISTRNFSL